ncbi:hypothetical protein M0R45_029843 [Rubus argutus]|uniref:Uncharacterized protein n=1 Tax=Rubus argutus TaxID=59490 RepID=A0AAW1WD64_RUBAR
MARTLVNKPGFRHLLTRFITSRRSLQTLAYEEVRASTVTPYHSTALYSMAFSAPPEIGDLLSLPPLQSLRSIWLENAQDLANLIESQNWAWPDVVLGHSLGGKVALQFAQSCDRGHYGDYAKLPNRTAVGVDSVPGEVNPIHSNGDVERVCRHCRVYLHQFPRESGL